MVGSGLSGKYHYHNTFTVFLVVLLVAFYCCSSFVLLYHNLNNGKFSPACSVFRELMIFYVAS